MSNALPIRVAAGRLPDDEAAAARAWRDPLALLGAGSAGDVLVRIVPGDPLGVGALCVERLSARALFLPPERVILRAFAHVARAALLWRGRPALRPWLVACIDAALDELLGEQAERLALDAGAAPEPGEAFRALAAPLGLGAESAALACARFHALDEDLRRVFWSVVVEGRDPPGTAGRKELLRRLRRVLDTLLEPARAGPPPS